VLLQRKREELAGAELMPMLDDAAAEPILGVAMGRVRQRTSVELERKSERGERTTLRLTARPMRREDHASAVVLVEDVTQQKVADESRNAFVAQATHELRTPLTNIRLYVETMVEDGENDPQVRAKCLNVIGNEARRLERIVSDMLSVSEIEAGSLKLRSGDIRLDALFEELHADFKAQAEDKEIKLNFAMPPKLPVMIGDRDKLMLALHNLVGNALKYTPTGGVVMVQVDAGADLRVAVTDNGIGISPEEQELIFEKFYRAKDRRIAGITGSGIGLALARQVVRMHGGDISVTSQIDKGSTFTMSVPVAQQVKAAA
jgi:signal transduction histidine kinase